ncbi:DMT family transporter [Nocardioides acrostichi]|uniref:Multidrug efflux SMR transporter n=1 Tax=Nocardioides acrostichi TaxID=2784339 RepID=A0A930V088_9ACTN|nr:multidrug efflux SMR transporter [Nocardioides acrostichi]MBF4160849.1 multidrug efflux SMR transporter [Nocardioides acrostichi]
MVYLLLGVAIVLEVIGTSLLRATDGFTRLLPSLGVVIGYGGAALLLSHVVKHLPVGVTYAIWSAVGTALVVTIGVTVLGDRFTPAVGLGLVMVVAGVVVLNLSGSTH